MHQLYTSFTNAVHSGAVKKSLTFLLSIIFAGMLYAAPPPAPTITIFSPSSGPIGTLVTITGTNLTSPTALTIGGVSAIAVSNTGTSLVAMVMPGATTGTVVVTTAGGTATSASNFTVIASQAPNAQQGSKLVGTGATGVALQGYSVALSADGMTAMVGGLADNSSVGAAWIYTFSGGVWTQQGSKLVGTGSVGYAGSYVYQGYSVALSADGNTAILGGFYDNSIGAAWIFTRSGGTWTQQGSKLTANDNTGAAHQGTSVSLSADGNTAMVGGRDDNGGIGAAWVYTRSGSTWTQQGSKLIASDATASAQQGSRVSLSADGNTAIVGGYGDNSNVGAAWIWTRSGSTWTQQGSKLVASDATANAQQGYVSLSADGNTAIVGGNGDNSGAGAAWIWTRSGSTWTQQGSKLVASDATANAQQGYGVSLSADGNTAIVGGNGDNSNVGATWIWTRSGSTWTQQGSKLVASDATANARQGWGVSLSANGNTAMVGGYADNSNTGAAWVYTYVPPPTISSFTASSGAVGTLVTISGTNLSSPTALTIGGVSAIAISNTGTSLVAMVMPGAATGTVIVTTAGGTATSASNFTVTATNYPSAQQGSKLVGTGASDPASQGLSVAVSSDGNTAIVGGYNDNSGVGAAWVYTRSGSTWTQQGSKLVGTGASGTAAQGQKVSLSADGNTAIVGGYHDNSNTGAVWIYTRTAGVWTQQGSKLTANDNIGAAQQGRSVSLSADGNTAIVGGYADNSNAGAVWIYTRTAGVWTQQGSKLVGTGATGAAQQGQSACLSSDGNTAVVGGIYDNTNIGAFWVYTRSGSTWTQQGTKLIGTGGSSASYQGASACLSADGNTVIEGGFGDNSNAGAVWVFTRSAGTWTQQGTKLVGIGGSADARQGTSVSLSADGNTAIVSGYTDNSNTGASWVYTRSGSTWTQQGNKLVGTNAVGSAQQGATVSLSADGNTAIEGGFVDNSNAGAAWVFTVAATPTISSFTASSGAVGTLVTITGTNFLTNQLALTIGGVSAIAISNTGTSLVAMVMPGATTGTVVVTTAGGTATSASNFTVTATNYPGAQQGSKLVGTGNTGDAVQGSSLSISADGNTAIVGGYNDNFGQGAAWVYTRSGGTWTQQGSKLVGTGNSGAASQGTSVSISADGNTAIVGGVGDNSSQGAAWVYTRSGSTWTQQGSKLVGTGNTGAAQQGTSVSVSADGNTAIVGGPNDNSNQGAAWVYTRSGGTWTQQGSKLVGTGNTGGAFQGKSVSLSADGNTAIVGGTGDNSFQGAAWVYTRSSSTWTQQGSKLVGTGNTGAAVQGISVSLSADGNTAIVGGYNDNSNEGAAWVFTRSGSTWTQQGSKLVGTGGSADARQGYSVSISADGNTAIVGGYQDNSNQGAAWAYTRSGSTWTQQGSKLVGTGNTGAAQQGFSVSMSADGNTAFVGGYADNINAGAAWVYIVGNTWTGATNTDWATATNWSYGTVPVSTDGVIIPSVSNQPIIGISTTAALNNLTINSSATLTVNNILQIGGTISNSGTITATSGTITMNGSSAQTIPASTFSTNTIKNLIINNSAGLTLAGSLNVTGTVTPTSGVLTTGGFLTLVSTVSGSGIIAQGSGSYLSGSVTVQRYVGNSIQWRMVGFPFTAATTVAESTLAGFYTSGYKAYTYNEAADNGAYGGSGAVNGGWSAFTTGTITANKGLLLSGGTIPSVINFSGPVNAGNQTITLSYSGSNPNKGWNLIANPFASNIDWDLVHVHNSCGVDNAIYRYDPNTTAYATYVNGSSSGNQSKIIENGAAFFVHSPGTTSLIINEADKTNSAPAASLMGLHQTIGTITAEGIVNTGTTAQYNQSIIKLSLSKQGDVYGDEVVLRWGGPFNVTDQFDSRYDAYDRGRQIGPDLSVIGTDKTVYSIFHGSALNSSNTENRTLQLGMNNMGEGSYQIKLNLLSTLANNNQAYLIDRYSNENILIGGTDSVYAFKVNADTLSQSAQRFAVTMNYKAVDHNTANNDLPVLLLNNPSTGHLFTLYSKNNYNQLQWEIVDEGGRSLQTGLLSNVLKGSTHQINVGNSTQGSYFIKLNGDGNVLPVLKAIKN